jgi:CubicO group peptidase (beta-lactamase class C family)
MISRPDQRFQYGPSHLTVFGEVLRRKLAAAGRDTDPTLYLEEHILKPLGVESVRWDRDAAGNADLSGGAHLSARQWARFGRLLRDDGIWKKRRLLGPEALSTLREGTKQNPGFGLSIWTNPRVKQDGTRAPWIVERPSFYPEGLPDLLVASGKGGQRLYVIPSLDLVVVRFASRSHGFRDAELLEHIVGAASPTPPESASRPVNAPPP